MKYIANNHTAEAIIYDESQVTEAEAREIIESDSFTSWSGSRVEVENADKTGTHEYSIIRITAETADACQDELEGQISDGIFENSRTGRVEEVEA